MRRCRPARKPSPNVSQAPVIPAKAGIHLLSFASSIRARRPSKVSPADRPKKRLHPKMEPCDRTEVQISKVMASGRGRRKRHLPGGIRRGRRNDGYRVSTGRDRGRRRRPDRIDKYEYDGIGRFQQCGQGHASYAPHAGKGQQCCPIKHQPACVVGSMIKDCAEKIRPRLRGRRGQGSESMTLTWRYRHGWWREGTNRCRCAGNRQGRVFVQGSATTCQPCADRMRLATHSGERAQKLHSRALLTRKSRKTPTRLEFLRAGG